MYVVRFTNYWAFNQHASYIAKDVTYNLVDNCVWQEAGNILAKGYGTLHNIVDQLPIMTYISTYSIQLVRKLLIVYLHYQNWQPKCLLLTWMIIWVVISDNINTGIFQFL